MIEFYKCTDKAVTAVTEKSEANWINLTHATLGDLENVATELGIDPTHLAYVLDDEEYSRMVALEDNKYIIVDIPAKLGGNDLMDYNTVPLSISVVGNRVVTATTVDHDLFDEATRERLVLDAKETTEVLVLKIVLTIINQYQRLLRQIDHERLNLENKGASDTSRNDVIKAHQLESVIVYFETSLRSLEVVLNELKLSLPKRMISYERDLFSAVFLEVKQAIEMASIYRNIMGNTRELLSTLIDISLNNIMKFMTSITVVMAIPTIISGFYGMNVSNDGVPFAQTINGFHIVVIISFIISILLAIWLRHNKWM